MDTNKKTPAVPASELLAFSGDRLLVTHQLGMDRLARKDGFSASTFSSMEDCPSRWAAEKVLRDHMDTDPFAAHAIGSAMHDVLEHFYLLDPEQRTQSAAMTMLLREANKIMPAVDDDARASRALWTSTVWEKTKGLWQIEDPAEIDVIATEREIKGVEVFGVPFVGKIDRTAYEPDKTGKPVVTISDYKSSNKVPDLRFGDGYGDQQRLYGEAVRVVDGKRPPQARLLYTKVGQGKTVAWAETRHKDTKRRWQTEWDNLNSYLDQASFPTKHGGLCGYCPLVNACPVNQNHPKVRADATGMALTADQLEIPGSAMPVAWQWQGNTTGTTLEEEAAAWTDDTRAGASVSSGGSLVAGATKTHSEGRTAGATKPRKESRNDKGTNGSDDMDFYHDDEPASSAPRDERDGWVTDPETGEQYRKVPRKGLPPVPSKKGQEPEVETNEVSTEDETVDETPVVAPTRPARPKTKPGQKITAPAPSAETAPSAEEDVPESFDDDPEPVIGEPRPSAGDDSQPDRPTLRRVGDESERQEVRAPSGQNDKQSRTEENEDTMNNAPFKEGKPYFECVGDELNAGSYAAGAVLDLTAVAYKTLYRAGMPLSQRYVRSLAHTLAGIVLEVQETYIGNRSFHGGLNAKLRRHLVEVLMGLPVPFGKEDIEWADWRAKVVIRLKAIVSIAFDMWGSGVEANGMPWQELVGVQPTELSRVQLGGLPGQPNRHPMAEDDGDYDDDEEHDAA